MSEIQNAGSRILSRLLWKDFQMIKPLVIAIAVGVVAFNLLALILREVFGQDTNGLSDMILWVLMPNLVALGAPSMLVGTEQETGTLDWTRSIPVSWQKIVLSKFLTAIAATASIWLLASIVLWVMISTGDPIAHPFNSEVNRSGEVLYSLFFSFALLFTGFITSFLLRSPVAAIIAVVPLFLAPDIVLVYRRP